MEKEFFTELRDFLLINKNCSADEMEDILNLVNKFEVV